MNNKRRGEIKILKEQIIVIKKQLESIQNDEQFAFDSLPEGLQQSQRGEESEEAIDLMDNALDKLDDAISELEDIL